MIVRNEENFLGDCLSSVHGFVDEMLVVDTGSTDSTISIALSMGAIVKHFPWSGDFEPARNFALDLVKGEWVLVLDADERLHPECKASLESFMSMDDSLLINLLRYEQGSLMSPYSSVSRLFRRHPKIRWNRPYHSMVDDSVKALIQEEPIWKIRECNIPAIIHYGYSPNLLVNSDKSKRLRDAMELWLSRNPGDPYTCAKLGALEISEGSRERGLFLLRQGIANLETNPCNYKVLYELLFTLGVACTSSNVLDAIDYYRQALSLRIGERAKLGALCNLCDLLLNRGLNEEARELAIRATKSAPEISLVWYMMGLVHRKFDELLLAINAYKKAIDLNPSHPESYQNLGVVKFLIGNIYESRKDFNKALNLFKEQGRNSEYQALKQNLIGFIKLD